ncbi:MAG: ATP-binding cassette domain-containing protein, partial [Rhodospirillales bacterium]
IELGLASLFVNLLALASPLFVIQVLNRYVNQGVDATLVTLMMGVLLAVGLEFGFRQIRMRLADGVSASPDAQAAADGFAILTQAKTGAIEQVSPEIRNEMVSGAASLEAAYNANNITAVLDVPFALLFVFVLYLLSPIIAGVVCLFLIFVFISGAMGAASIRKKTKKLMEVSAYGNAIVGTALKEIDTVRAFNAGGYLIKEMAEKNVAIQTVRQKIASGMGLNQTTTHTAASLLSVFVISVGALLAVKGLMDIGVMIGANILAARALQPISKFSSLGATFAKARQALELYKQFAALPLEPRTGTAKANYKGGFSFRDVAFSHHGASTPLFESLNLEVEAGQTIVVIGSNSTGKTTLARVAVGLLEPSRGQILADGLDLKQVAPEWWRKQIIYLPQEPTFLNATIEQNLSGINPDIDLAGLNRVIDAVGLRTFLDESSNGFDTPVVDNGRRLSVGIRRRLAFARALTTNGKLIIADEPTEGLDTDGCQAVYRLFNELSKAGRTIIAISHDQNIMKAAHTVIDLNFKPTPKVTTISRAVSSRDTASQSVEKGAAE